MFTGEDHLSSLTVPDGDGKGRVGLRGRGGTVPVALCGTLGIR